MHNVLKVSHWEAKLFFISFLLLSTAVIDFSLVFHMLHVRNVNDFFCQVLIRVCSASFPDQRCFYFLHFFSVCDPQDQGSIFIITQAAWIGCMHWCKPDVYGSSYGLVKSPIGASESDRCAVGSDPMTKNQAVALHGWSGDQASDQCRGGPALGVLSVQD